jgi:hypothetical protein
MLRFPRLHLETIVVIPFSKAFEEVEKEEKPETVPFELLHMLQLVKHPATVGQEFVDAGVVQMDGSTEGQRHGIRP